VKDGYIRLRAQCLEVERDCNFYKNKNNYTPFSDIYFVPLVDDSKVVSFVTSLPHLVLRVWNVTVPVLYNANK
jgi:hypothetical protein